MSLAELGNQPGIVETIVRRCQYVSDPLQAFEMLCEKGKPSLLLESAEIESKDNLQSLLLVDAALRIECNGRTVICEALNDNGASVLPLFRQHCPHGISINEEGHTVTLNVPDTPSNFDEDSRLKAVSVFDGLRTLLKSVCALRDHPHSVFLGGAFAYDLLGSFENLPKVNVSENTCPDYVFYLAETLLITNHKTQETELLGSVFSGEQVAQSYFSVSQKLEHISEQLSRLKSTEVLLTTNEPHSNCVRVDKSDAVFKQDVLHLKEHILAGDIFQVVPSRTFSLPCPSPRKSYAKLKQTNPSPYMFYLQDRDFSIFGASPESALKYEKQSNQVEIYPIAGTRARGKRPDGSIDADLDSRVELDLRNDDKEKAEHIMLVDLARNDVAKVSQPGTRYVKDLLKVDRYSHVMHLVSRVVGQLRNDLDTLHAYQACMNMGTLVGAPKISAASLIREMEQKRRGSYGGAVGYINGRGDMDTCIVIRSAFVRNQTAYIQAGAGVVYDSDPQAEADETRSKAQAVVSAVQATNNTQEVA
ncbi:anthranilate synthase component 1 [Alteromonas sp. ASW11-130]|uniref:anthranilate synthase component 1 n=1 Tax=Alteromonas sp. ASW11-130 TaxID=3015775 RepID=UPI002242085A|nr:anthranilate synthase component 1 [Alteromonas sp. ASW11-130]MCW8091407.1 anthranilate synthase component 1 [Alteromonas sp. ASW11-130]